MTDRHDGPPYHHKIFFGLGVCACRRRQERSGRCCFAGWPLVALRRLRPCRVLPSPRVCQSIARRRGTGSRRMTFASPSPLSRLAGPMRNPRKLAVAVIPTSASATRQKRESSTRARFRQKHAPAAPRPRYNQSTGFGTETPSAVSCAIRLSGSKRRRAFSKLFVAIGRSGASAAGRKEFPRGLTSLWLVCIKPLKNRPFSVGRPVPIDRRPVRDDKCA